MPIDYYEFNHILRLPRTESAAKVCPRKESSNVVTLSTQASCISLIQGGHHKNLGGKLSSESVSVSCGKAPDSLTPRGKPMTPATSLLLRFSPHSRNLRYQSLLSPTHTTNQPQPSAKTGCATVAATLYLSSCLMTCQFSIPRWT